MTNLAFNKTPNSTNIILSESLQNLLRIHDISAADLSRELNIPYNTINRILNGSTTDPRMSTIQLIANFFGVTSDYLVFGRDNTKILNEKWFIALLTWEELRDIELPCTIEKYNKDNSERQYIPINKDELPPGKNQSCFFALKSTKSMYPRYPFGTVFIIDSSEKFIDGDIVLVKFLESMTTTMREVITDGPECRLEPIVPNSTSLVFNDKEHRIIGVNVLTLIKSR